MGGGGRGEAQCLTKMGKNKKRKKKYGWDWKLNSKYSTTDIQFSYLNFKNFHPYVQNNVRNCVQHKQTNKKQKNKNKKTKVGMGVKYYGLLTHFICRVNMIVFYLDLKPWVQVWVQCHGYGYGNESCMSKSHWYGSETTSMGTGTNFCIGINMGTVMGKGTTTSLLGWALYSCSWKTWLQVCPWRKAL